MKPVRKPDRHRAPARVPFRAALGLALAAGLWLAPRGAVAQPSMSGLSGHWNAPGAELLGDGRLEFGYNSIPKRWAYDHRGLFRNDVYFATLGFLSRVEVSVRVTSLPGFIAFSNVDSASRLTDADRMVSAKVQFLRASGLRPDVAAGVEDLEGTRRFHTAYIVAGRSFPVGSLQLRVDAGLAGPVFRQRTNVTLNGVFGAAELRAAGRVTAGIEYDSEKWNLGLKARGPAGFTARLVWLNARDLSGGFGLGVNL